jgi:type IV secretory pathway TrbD component
MASHLPPGFEVPVFRALYEPNLIAGIRRELFYALWIGSAVGIGEAGLRRMWWLVPVAFGLHILAALATRHDPDFLDVVKRAFRFPERLDP